MTVPVFLDRFSDSIINALLIIVRLALPYRVFVVIAFNYYLLDFFKSRFVRIASVKLTIVYEGLDHFFSFLYPFPRVKWLLLKLSVKGFNQQPLSVTGTNSRTTIQSFVVKTIVFSG